MKVLKSWLKDYIDFDWSDEELADKLSYSGTLVEDYYGKIDKLVVVAEIKSIKKHPNADKLNVVKVFDGISELDIVCGAKNISEGILVPLAKVGARLPDGEIKKVNIRDVESKGMICSQKELGLGDDHEGILILNFNKDTIGKSLSDIENFDTIFDLEITPNRGDCVSHIGVAREISVIQNKTFKKQPLELKMSSESASNLLSLKVQSEKLCPRYFARVIKNVKIGDSPDWLKKRLEDCGIRSINNVVDVTNYIMLDLGQPMHAFDLDKVKNSSINVRSAKNNEKITALDEKTYELNNSDLVIADGEKAIAIAGIIGGENSHISEKTRDIVLEAAEFDRRCVRSTSKKLGVVTEASYRFERGIDSSAVEYSINKAAKMIHELAGGTILSGIVKFEAPKEINFVNFNHNKINALLGTNLLREHVDNTLRLLGFKIKGDTAEIPSWRHDIGIWQDLAEEIARIEGLNNIQPKPILKSIPQKKSLYYYKEYLKDLLVNEGYSEVYTYSLLSESDIKEAQLEAKDLLEISNPIQPENKYLRPSIIPGLLKVVAKNPTFDPILIFEMANVFDKKNEKTKLSVAASGKGADASIKEIKNRLEGIIKDLTINIKEISREELSRFKIRKPFTYVFEIDLSNIDKKMNVKSEDLKLKIYNNETIYRPISKYPSVTRDLAFIIDKKIKPDELRIEIYKISEIINRVELFDEFVSDKLGKDKKNLAFHIYLQSKDKSLDDNEANQIIDNVIKIIEKKYQAKLRK